MQWAQQSTSILICLEFRYGADLEAETDQGLLGGWRLAAGWGIKPFVPRGKTFRISYLVPQGLRLVFLGLVGV